MEGCVSPGRDSSSICDSHPSTPWLLATCWSQLQLTPTVRHKLSMAQELGHNGMGIPGLAADGWRSSSFHPSGLDLLLYVASSPKFPPYAMNFLLLVHLHLVGPGLRDGLRVPMQFLWGKKKICFDFQAEIVILFLENRAINLADAKQTLCNVCIKVGWGGYIRKGWYLSLTCLSAENALVFIYWLLDFHPACILASLFAQMNSDLKTAKLSRKIFPFQLST